jgi:hypothetical protein
VESELSQDAGISKARSTSTLVFLDLFYGAPFGAVFHHRVFFVEVNCERSSRTDESPTQDFWPSRGALTAGERELEASTLSKMYTLAAISLASGQSSNESPSEPMRGRETRESRAGLIDNESNNASVSLDERSTTSALGIVTIKRGDEACACSNSCEAYAWQPKLTKSTKYEYIT